MLYNKEFLLKLDKSKNKTIYARLTALQFNESPIETIEGRVTQGSINIDGASAVRRTCSLTIAAQNFNYNNYYWGLNTKFKLEIGLQNLIDSSYPDIIWFKQGIYLITSFNTSHSTNNFIIQISGKDKMCLLNGEVSGSFESSIDFGKIEEEGADGAWEIRKIPIPEIIRNMIHTYAGEPYWNIIINDLDTYGLELLEYRYDTPMYLYRQKDTNLYDNILLDGEKECEVYEVGIDGNPTALIRSTILKDLQPDELEILVDTLTGSSTPKLIKMDGKFYYVAKVEYGQTAGYRTTDLVYAGDLIANVGENVVTILDKIKNMLVEFEYFYDLDGHFIFQKKRSFAHTLWSPLGTDEKGDPAIIESLALASATAYTFSGGELITAFNNTPNLLNLRNDYAIWGQRVGISGANIPVHLRYAIDIKPTSYTQIYVEENNPDIIAYNKKYGTNLSFQSNPQTFTTDDGYDWREIIYQMALDYFRYNTLDDFELRLIEANPQYYTGQTGYEGYYTDLEGFWRQLYNPFIDKKLAELQNSYDNIVPEENKETKDKIEKLEKEIAELKKEKLKFYYNDNDGVKKFWNRTVFESPETLNFWFDFLDSDGELAKYNVKSIGVRTKSINDTNVKSIYFRETPSVIFVENIAKEDMIPSYRYIQIPNQDTMFSISAQGKSAKNKLDELIYQHSYCIESVSITTIPIYYLEPNVRIELYDQKSGLDGEYIINKITLPLSYNGTMNITAIKAAKSLQ